MHLAVSGWALMACLFAPFAAAELTLQLNSLKVEENERIQLTLRIDRNGVEEPPNFDALKKDFTILGRPSRTSKFQSINGRITGWTDWTLQIQPKRTGRLVIPPITYEGETSLSQSILVSPLDPKVKRTLQKRVFFETSTVPEKPYVQAQITFTRRLLYSQGTQIYGEIPDTPKIESAVVIQLGTPKSRKVQRFGKPYSMIEQRYAIFPESSGQLTIPGANVTGSIRTIVNNRIRRNSLSVNADPINIDVQGVPAAYPADQPWFPAEDVQIIDAWDIDPLVFTVGEPINQSVIVSSAGSTGSIIPPLDYQLPTSHFRIYPEQPNISDNPADDNVLGVRSQAFSLIPIAAGTVELPEVELTWWDTKAEKVRVARLASRSVNVNGESVVEQTTSVDGETTGNEPAPNRFDPVDPAEQLDDKTWLRLGLWIAGLFALIIAFRWFLRSGLPSPTKLLQRSRNESPRRALRALQHSISNDTPSDIRQAFEHYLNTLRNKHGEFDEGAASAFRTLLSNTTYAPDQRVLDRDRLEELAQGLSQSQDTERTQPLPALYKQRA